jgi:hypothetical protein
MEQSACSYALWEMYFSNVQNPGIFGVPNQILRDTGTELLRTHKTTSVPIKPRLMESLSTHWDENSVVKQTTIPPWEFQSNFKSLHLECQSSFIARTHARTHTHNYSFTPSIVAHTFGGLGLILSVKHCSTHMHSLVTSGLTIVQQPTLLRDFPWFISHVQNHVLARRAVVPAAAAAAAQVAMSSLPYGFLSGRARRLCYDGLLECDGVQSCSNISKKSSASIV